MGTEAAFLSDEGGEKGSGWAVFSAEVALTGMYEARLLVPSAADAPGCDPRATAAPVVVHHSGTARRTVSAADLSPPGPGKTRPLAHTLLAGLCFYTGGALLQCPSAASSLTRPPPRGLRWTTRAPQAALQ